MLQPTWNPFSKYADRMEKRADRMLWGISYTNIFETQKKMLALMQENLVIVSLWLEAKFKGYKYLKKRVRKKLYVNSEKIARAFLEFALKTQLDFPKITANLHNLGLRVPESPEDREKLKYLYTIMLFLSPKGRYEYLDGASFGKLLSDPSRGKKMIGDCNQIVTFYVFLFAQKYNIKDLQIKLLKEHVCLHFKGIDIEATAGTFANYRQYLHLLPVVELVPTNLLDVSDFRDKQIKVDPRHLLKAAHLAKNLSSKSEIVDANLKIAYHNVAIDALNANDFESAKFFAEKAGAAGIAAGGAPDLKIRQLLETVFHNAVIYYIKERNFKKARYYLDQSHDEGLRKYMDENEAFYFYDHGSVDRAREIFERTGNRQMVKACYAKEYNEVQSRVAGLTQIPAMKSHRYEYEKMLELARKMEDDALVKNLRDILKQL